MTTPYSKGTTKASLRRAGKYPWRQPVERLDVNKLQHVLMREHGNTSFSSFNQLSSCTTENLFAASAPSRIAIRERSVKDWAALQLWGGPANTADTTGLAGRRPTRSTRPAFQRLGLSQVVGMACSRQQNETWRPARSDWQVWQPFAASSAVGNCIRSRTSSYSKQ
jgi:hypothetical protein